MQVRLSQPPNSVPGFAALACFRAASLWWCAALFAALVPFAFGQQPDTQRPSNQAEPKPAPLLRPEYGRIPDKNDMTRMREQALKRASFNAANSERKRQLDADSMALLRFATEMKEDIGRDSHELSSELLRKAEEIERLAHNVQVKMKLTVSAAN
jgi:hypothetical protein